MSGSPSYESGLRNHRTEYLNESTVGTVRSNPNWNRYSDVLREFDPDPGAGISSQRGRGDPDSQNAYAGTEEPSLTVTYDLQQKSGSGNTFLDGSSNPNDALVNGVNRTADNRLQEVHSLVDRIEQNDLSAANTVSGNTARDTRQYWVGKGGYIDEVTVAGDPEDGQPTSAELSYEFEKLRHYQFDQPTASESPIEVWINSTSAQDTDVQVTAEDEDADTSEALVTNGTTLVGPTTATFPDFDAAPLNKTAVGTINVFVDDGTGTAAGDKVHEIQGQNSYDHGEGDLGIPGLGSGSHASAFNQNYELYHDDTVEQPDGTTIGENFEGTEFTVSNNVDGTNRGGSARRALSAGDREVTVDVTVFGETETQERVVDQLTTATNNVRWEMGGGTLQADNADAREVDADALGAGESKSTVSVTFNGQGVTVE